MTLAEENALLARLARTAGAGEMLNIHDLKAAYEKAIGHATLDSTVYNPVPARLAQADAALVHPKRNLAAQDTFGFPDAVRRARRAASRRGRNAHHARR